MAFVICDCFGRGIFLPEPQILRRNISNDDLVHPKILKIEEFVCISRSIAICDIGKEFDHSLEEAPSRFVIERLFERLFERVALFQESGSPRVTKTLKTP